MTPKVAIIILNWNGWKDTLECLESLYQISYPNYEIILVDNHSEDDSIEKIKEYCRGEVKVESEFFDYKLSNKPIHVFEYFKDEIKDLNLFKRLNSSEKIILIKNDENYGFAEGNNIAMRFVLKNFDSEYVLLLNNDTVVEKEFLNDLIRCAIKYPKGGIVGPKIRFYDKPNILNSAGGKIIWSLGAGYNIGMGEKDLGQFDELSEYDYLMGACLLINTFLIRKIGFLDRKFFLLYEETDFCIRAKKAGYKLLLNPKSVIYHKVGISGEKVSPLYYYYMYRNRLLILRKHQKPIIVLLYGLYISLRTLIIIIYYTAKGDTEFSKSILKGYIQGIK
jgi:GT2 family glycosyltransferase